MEERRGDYAGARGGYDSPGTVVGLAAAVTRHERGHEFFMAELEVRVSYAEAGKGYVGSHAEAKDQLVRCLHREGTDPLLGHPRVHGEGKLAAGLVS